jgi:hypothetical protein
MIRESLAALSMLRADGYGDYWSTDLKPHFACSK